MRIVSFLVALATGVLACTSSSYAVGARDSADSRAVEVAHRALDRALSVGSNDVVPRDLLRSAVPGKALSVYDARTLGPAYTIVPLVDGDRTVGIMAIDPEAKAMLWCRFNVPRGRFPIVGARDAARVVAGRRVALGLAAETGEPILVQGCDKHLYWRFGSEEQSWLVDAMDESAGVRSSLDGSDRTAVIEEAVAKHARDGYAGRERDQAYDADNATSAENAPSFVNPASFVIPGLPYHFQIVDWYCGPAALQMVMDRLGEEIGQYDIGDVANEGPSYGCYDTDMRRAAHFSGMSTAIQNPALAGYAERKLGYACVDRILFTNVSQRVKNTICAGYPLYTLTWYDTGHYSGHFRVIKGYDDSLGVFVIHDPWYYGTLCGPDLLIDQTLFVDDLWAYSGHWCMVTSPWVLTPSVPSSVALGDTFSVQLRVLYPGPTVFSGAFACTDCRATISLPAGLELAGGSATVVLPNMDSADTASASWNIVAVGPGGNLGIGFQALGIVTGSSISYASYSDSIGGHAYEEVAVGSGLLAEWDEEERLTVDLATSETCFPGARAMVMGDDGATHLVWADTRDANSEIYYRRRAGGAWGAEIRLTNDPGHSTSPCIAVDPGGQLHVAWIDDRDGNYEVYYKKWDPVSGWSADERVTNYYEVDSRPAIAASASTVYLAWESRVDGYYRTATVYMAARSVGGWSTPAEIDPSASRDRYHPSLDFGTDELLHAVYERQTADTANEREEIAYRNWNGSTWSGPAVLSTSVSFSRAPVVTAGDDGRVHVVWQDGENVGGDVFYAVYDGSSWQPSEEIVTGSTEAGSPSVAADVGGGVHVAWVDWRHGESEIYCMDKDQTGWNEPTRLSMSAGASMLPTAAAGTAGEVCVVWTDLRNGNADLYFRSNSGVSGVWGLSVDAGANALFASRPWPTPFMDETRIALRLSERAPVRVEVFDIAGRLIRTLQTGTLEAGVYDLAWDGRCAGGGRAASGIYFLTCSSGGYRQARQVVLVR